MFDTSNILKATQELHYIQKNKLQYSYFLQADYPRNLLHCIDAPILIFKDGSIDISNDKIISIVGTRNMSSYGRDFCNQLLKDLSIYNPVIVSGFAYGVDIYAHNAAIKNNLQTVAVLAHGIEHTYPKIHKKYIHQVNENGGFLTEFWHDDPPQRENFLKRNRAQYLTHCTGGLNFVRMVRLLYKETSPLKLKKQLMECDILFFTPWLKRKIKLVD